MSIEFTLPSAQDEVLNAFPIDGRLRGAISPCRSWKEARTIRAGDMCPVFLQGNGTAWLKEAVWGYRTAESSELITTASPDGAKSAWPCLVPMRWSRNSEQPWCLVAGLWRPADQRNPESFVILTRRGDQSADTAERPRVLLVEQQYWPDWVNPQLDNRWLHERPWGTGFISEAVPA
jgi:putative SOS response-associated peptidase YedK